MALLPGNPFRSMNQWGKNMDDFFSDFPSMFTNENMGVKVDVHETDKEVIATCDIPGIEKKEDLNIDVSDNVLRLNGTIERSNDIKDENMHRTERYKGTFQRAVALPSPVSDEGVKASYKNGVLEVRMPRVEKDEQKRIDVDFQ